ncbi:MAG: nuclease A inhibitor family protein [Jaaginema sp. PMC 1079.18]|nr:nuclease A inhibitor family protein [Jaaginema sp. PMC 1080.18]MEC4850598.1 nuclease A inhibitor family protein [Jaaginema sp. PMC 1079.18]MEC4865383.1 nuclease A inhibitor family protein [Jaaginema sp. PMC 1078.18]
MSDRDLTQQLQQATEGLFWPSETDAEFEIVTWPDLDNLTVETVRDRLNLDPETPILCQDFYRFFQPVTQEQAWHNAEERAERERYQVLVEFLNANLSNLQVFRVGEVEIDIYILGQTPERQTLGLQTQAVET